MPFRLSQLYNMPGGGVTSSSSFSGSAPALLSFYCIDDLNKNTRLIGLVLNSAEIWWKLYLSVFVGKVDAQSAHGTNNGNQRLNGITVDNRLELFIVLACESTLVNDSTIVIIIIAYYAGMPQTITK